MIWIAACLVPRAARSQWRSDQQRKFWHWCHFLSESGQLTSNNRLLIAKACWELFPAAFWMRFEREQFLTRLHRIYGSPLAFLSGLLLAVLALGFGSGIIGSARAAYSPPVAHADRIVLITLDGNGINGKFSRTRSDTLLDLASIWSKSELAEGTTPFSWAPGNLLLPRRDLQVAVARVGLGFFATLGEKTVLGRVFEQQDLQSCPSCVLLSNSVWREEFHADPNIVGKAVDLNGVSRPVIGVLPPGFRLISPGIAVWGLIDPALLFTNFQRRVGAVARLHPGVTPEQLQRDLGDLTESGGYVHPSSQLQVVTIAAQLRRNLTSMIWLLLLVTGCAILVVAIRQASSGFGLLPEGATARWKWLGFFATKSALLLAAVALTSWCLVHWFASWTIGSINPLIDEYSIWLFLPLAIVALSWAFRDQQGRCRSCLQRLELPVEIGRPGSVLLNWAGTEMVCPVGHGVLYLAESPANSLDQGRWSKLDESWENLFREG
jgi:hypothetical protein